MPSITVVSKKHGNHTILFDDADYKLIYSYNWYVIKDGHKFYAHTWIKGNKIPSSMHRILMGESNPKVHIDHIDGNGLNNCRFNLRRANTRQNSWNKSKKITNKSGFKGVSYKTSHKKYSVSIKANNKSIWGGYFTTPEKAAERYNELAKIHFGEFAFLNVIP